VLWTPGYWGWNEGLYVWHPGYWGPHVGFYGGINYGFGYFGVGYAGGYWHGREFFYNRNVNNVTITNVHIYNRTVNNVTVNRVSYNGGHGGINARPGRDDERWAHERHFEATHMQLDHEHAARGNREFLASVNHGRPAMAATARQGEFHGRDVAPSRPQHEFRPAEGRPMNRPAPRPDNSARNMNRPNMDRPNNDRPMPRQDTSMNRGGGRPHEAPRPDNRGQGRSDLATHSTAYHAGNGGQHESAPRGNPAPHENAPRGNSAQHGNAQHGGGNEGHGRH